MCLFSSIVCGQESRQSDSLINLLKTSENDTSKVKICLELGDDFEYSAPDSALYFYNLALLYANKANSKKHISTCYFYIGLLHSEQSSYDIALSDFRMALKIKEDLKDKNGITSCMDNIGRIYFYQGKFEKSISEFLKSLKIREETGDKRGISKSYNSIGNVYYYMDDYKKAIEYYSKALVIIEDLGDKNGISSCYNNIGLVYMDQGKTLPDPNQVRYNYLKAIEFFTKSLKIDSELEDKKGMSACYANLGTAWLRLDDFDKAISYFMNSLKIDEEIGDKDGIALVLGDMADLKIKQKDYVAAIGFAERSLNIGKELGALPILHFSYEKLACAYDSLGNYKKAYENYKKYKQINDSLFNLEESKQIKQMEANYQSEKKQLEINNLTKDKELKDKELQKQRIIIYSFILGFLIIFVFSILLYRQFKEKNKANKLLANQNMEIQEMNNEISAQRDNLQIFNTELQQKNEEIMTQRDEIESHLDNIQKQKALIEQKNNDITASISYAQKIQQSVLPDEKFLKSLLPESFVLFKPKDIVSGDFYWLAPKNGKIYVAAVDCTGHGVPGAFMSLLGYVFLNQAILGTNVSSPAEILNYLSNEIYVTLRKSDINNYVKDGMDLSLCAINKEDLLLEYAGVHNDSYLIRNNVIMELKPDNFQIGEPFSDKFTSFTNKSVKLEKGDLIYLFTDGFLDQFGGKDNKKFMAKQFKETLLKISTYSMKKQSKILEETLLAWKNNFEVKHKQTDDITVIGIKI